MFFIALLLDETLLRNLMGITLVVGPGNGYAVALPWQLSPDFIFVAFSSMVLFVGIAGIESKKDFKCQLTDLFCA